MDLVGCMCIWSAEQRHLTSDNLWANMIKSYKNIHIKQLLAVKDQTFQLNRMMIHLPWKKYVIVYDPRVRFMSSGEDVHPSLRWDRRRHDNMLHVPSVSWRISRCNLFELFVERWDCVLRCFDFSFDVFTFSLADLTPLEVCKI